MEKGKLNEILISGIAYIPKDSVTSMAPVLDGMEYCMVRTYSAGVFADTSRAGTGKKLY